jgi:hypothetical protein
MLQSYLAVGLVHNTMLASGPAVTLAGGKSRKRIIIAVAVTISQPSCVPLLLCCALLLQCVTARAGGKPKKRSIITDTFQGELEVTTLAGTGKGKAAVATVSGFFAEGCCCCVCACCWKSRAGLPASVCTGKGKAAGATVSGVNLWMLLLLRVWLAAGGAALAAEGSSSSNGAWCL